MPKNVATGCSRVGNDGLTKYDRRPALSSVGRVDCNVAVIDFYRTHGQPTRLRFFSNELCIDLPQVSPNNPEERSRSTGSP